MAGARPAQGPAHGPEPLSGSTEPLAARYDVALLDLDGVVYRGRRAVPYAADAIRAARDGGMRTCFVTNNALRPPAAVAAHLGELGVPTEPAEVVTAAQAAARVLAEHLPAGATVLVVGGAGLREAVAERDFRAVSSAADDPVAVVQGYDPELTYARLAEAALAVRAGALWVASNADATVPTERGLLPGNGSLVALVATATGATPIVAGKPEWALHAESLRRSGARRPLVVGDRLDTDIEAATRADTPSLLVLTGVTTPADLPRAAPAHRPTYLAADLRGLGRAHPPVRRAGLVASCGRWRAGVVDGVLGWEQLAAYSGAQPDGALNDDGLDALRAGVAAAWLAGDAGRPWRLAADRPPGCETLE